MPYYKTPDNDTYYLDDGVLPSDVEGFPADAVEIPEDEAKQLAALTVGKFIKTKFTSLEYLDRFTEAEQLAVATAAMSNPAVKLWYDRMLAASYVDIEDPRVAAGIDALITAGLLDAGRKEALLQPIEI
ncbi:MAG TPA: hypothetical protein VN023_09590 [Methylovorus sp.]|nr:hypothetical protein [Methylovorus sp.]